MAMHSPRTPAVTRQKPSERSHKTRDCETAAKKSKSAEVEESRNRTRHEPERDTSSQGRVERRDRRGKRAAGWKGEHRAAARGPGEEATDETSSSISLASMPSSQTTPPKPETTRQAASEAAADAANPNATSAGPTGPAGASCKPQDAPHGIADDSARGQGQEANEGVEGEGETSTGRTGEEITAAKAPGEGTADQTADGVSLAAPASSPNDDGGDEDVHHTHVAPNETPPTASKPTPHERTPHVERSSGEGQGVAGNERETGDDEEECQAETPMHETAAPLSMPLEGERNSQVTSDNTGAHCSKGAERPDNTADAQDSTQTQRCTNGTHAGQRHGASAHGEGRCARAEQPCSAHERDSCVTSSSAQVPDGIAEDPGGRVKPSTHPDRPPSTSLEGERGHEPSSSRADDGTIVRAHEAQLEAQRGHLEAEEDHQYKARTRDHAPAPPSMPLEGERGGWRSIGHAREEVRSQSGTKPAHNEDDAAAAAAAQPVSRRSGCVHIPVALHYCDLIPPQNGTTTFWIDRELPSCHPRLQRPGELPYKHRFTQNSSRQARLALTLADYFTSPFFVHTQAQLCGPADALFSRQLPDSSSDNNGHDTAPLPAVVFPPSDPLVLDATPVPSDRGTPLFPHSTLSLIGQ
ncbi:hypothetical protein BU15DRAFT_83687 [Melanogaster broomeanus]|nr:hypothetical protein BU15DRAFT_83687 [Melanogaster broomeanus]